MKLLSYDWIFILGSKVVIERIKQSFEDIKFILEQEVTNVMALLYYIVNSK